MCVYEPSLGLGQVPPTHKHVHAHTHVLWTLMTRAPCLFQFGLMQIISHEEALTILSRSVDPRDPPSMLEAVRLLAAICLVPPDG